MDIRPTGRSAKVTLRSVLSIISSPGAYDSEGHSDELALDLGRKEDHRHVSRVQDVLHRLYIVCTRQHQVEKDQIGPLLFPKAQPPGIWSQPGRGPP